MHIQIHQQDHQSDIVAVGERDGEPAADVVVVDSDEGEDDFEICTKPCVAADFASEDEYSRHMLRHVRPFSIRVRKLDLSRYQRIPYRQDSFYVPRKPGPACYSRPARQQVLVGGFRVELANLSCLSADFVYQVEQRIVDPALFEPIVLLYVSDAAGRLRLVSSLERMTINNVVNTNVVNTNHYKIVNTNHYNAVNTNHYYVAKPMPVSCAKPEEGSMEELAACYGVPLDYLMEVTRSFGSSHFLNNTPLSQMPLFPTPAKPRIRYPPPVKRTSSSDVVVLRNADGSATISGEINLAQTSRIVSGPLSNSTLVPSSFASGAFTANTAPGSTKRLMLAPMSRLQLINGAHAAATGSKMVGRQQPMAGSKIVGRHHLMERLLAPKEPRKPTKEVGASNQLVMKRVPLSVRQPPYPKVVPAERKAAKIQCQPSEPLLVPVGRPAAASPSRDLSDEVIDLLSDDEKDTSKKAVDQNDVGRKEADKSETEPKEVDGIGATEVEKADIGPEKVDEKSDSSKKADDQNDESRQKINDVTERDPGEDDDQSQTSDEVEEIIVLE